MLVLFLQVTVERFEVSWQPVSTVSVHTPLIYRLHIAESRSCQAPRLNFEFLRRLAAGFERSLRFDKHFGRGTAHDQRLDRSAVRRRHFGRVDAVGRPGW